MPPLPSFFQFPAETCPGRWQLLFQRPVPDWLLCLEVNCLVQDGVSESMVGIWIRTRDLLMAFSCFWVSCSLCPIQWKETF